MSFFCYETPNRIDSNVQNTFNPAPAVLLTLRKIELKKPPDFGSCYHTKHLMLQGKSATGMCTKMVWTLEKCFRSDVFLYISQDLQF